MERDHALGVRRALRDEVDDDPGLLARVEAHDAADPLLVDAARRGRREVHADGRARRVPALGEELRVDEDVDLAALVGGERLGELDRRRLAADGLGLEPDGAELLREVVGVLDAGRVDDPRRVVEPVAVERRGRLVQRLVVEGLGQELLVEVAADDRHRVDRRHGRDAEVAQRRDQAPARGLGEREVVDGGGEDVRDLLRDQLLRRGHADVDRLRVRADGAGRLLAERGVRLVRDHEVVRLARELAVVPREPGVGLDRERVRDLRLLALEDRLGEPGAVALVAQVAGELVDEQAAVREDQDAEGAAGLDEARRGDRLSRRGRVAEAEAAHGAGVLALELGLLRLLVERAGEPQLVLGLVVLLGVGLGGVPPLPLVSAAVSSWSAISSVSIPASASTWWRRSSVPDASERRLLAEHALEPEHEAPVDLPPRRRRREPRLHLGERGVERTAARRPGREARRGIFARPQERLSRPALRPLGGIGKGGKRLRRDRRLLCRGLHRGSALWRRCPY